MNKKPKLRNGMPDKPAASHKKPASEKASPKRSRIQEYARAYGFIF